MDLGEALDAAQLEVHPVGSSCRQADEVGRLVEIEREARVLMDDEPARRAAELPAAKLGRDASPKWREKSPRRSQVERVRPLAPSAECGDRRGRRGRRCERGAAGVGGSSTRGRSELMSSADSAPRCATSSSPASPLGSGRSGTDSRSSCRAAAVAPDLRPRRSADRERRGHREGSIKRSRRGHLGKRRRGCGSITGESLLFAVLKSLMSTTIQSDGRQSGPTLGGEGHLGARAAPRRRRAV